MGSSEATRERRIRGTERPPLRKEFGPRVGSGSKTVGRAEGVDDELFEQLISSIRREFDEDSAATLERAFQLADALEPAAQADLARVANALLAQHADVEAVSSALLAPLLWGSKVTQGEVASGFGPAISDLSRAIVEPARLRTDTEDLRRLDLQRLLESFTSDLRTVVLTVVLRVDALARAVDGLASPQAVPGPDARAYAREALDIYVPLCGRLGLGVLRQQLEDLAFQVLDPEGHGVLAREVAPLRKEDEAALALLRRAVSRQLTRAEIDARVEGRVKGLYSLHRKMVHSGKTLREVMDKLGLRIIVRSVPECYAVLGVMHTHYRPVDGRFKDYIGLPKDNGYQSLHTCVYPIHGISEKPVELQIRTEQMHMEAEFGVAAHWRYKSEQEAATEGARQMAWLRTLPRQHREASSHTDFVERLRRQVFEDHVVVFGPGGQRLRFPEGGTVADLVARLGRGPAKTAGVRVNGKERGLDYELQDGDAVEILSAPEHQPTDEAG